MKGTNKTKLLFSLACLLLIILAGLMFSCLRPADERRILVEATGDTAVVSAWERRGEKWREVFRASEGYVGRSGVIDPQHKQEGDGATPTGEYELYRSFGTEDRPETALSFTHVGVDDVWVDDPDSRYYNQYVHEDAGIKKDWKSAEELSRLNRAYKYAIVVEYNTHPVVPGKGSAIFLNLSDGHSTAGDIAVPEEDMLRFLKFVQPGDKIVIRAAQTAGSAV